MADGIPAPFAPYAIPWDGPQLTADEIAFSTNAFEWWYFDLASADGRSLVLVLSRRNPVFAPGKSAVYVEYHDGASGFKHVRNHPEAAFSWAEGPDGRVLRVADSQVRLVGDRPETLRYEVTVRTEWLSADLTLTPEHLGFLPTADGRYFTHREDPRRFTAVAFAAPLMRGTGTITVGGRTAPISGRGYHDHPWGTEQLFATHHEWNWARAATPAEGVMFAKVTPAEGFEGALTFCYRAPMGDFQPTVTADLTVEASDWRKDAWNGLRYPHALTVGVPGMSWRAVSTGALLDTLIYDRSGITWTPQAGPAGTGWVEYFHLPTWARGLAAIGARAQAFFWRRFPWVGQ
ncbi:MAG: hypothetical protein K1X31_00680 [Gemmatimonadaceae bacterium]|nr:hypothetical protein [Gemmatimonadaceae bacterium]